MHTTEGGTQFRKQPTICKECPPERKKLNISKGNTLSLLGSPQMRAEGESKWTSVRESITALRESNKSTLSSQMGLIQISPRQLDNLRKQYINVGQHERSPMKVPSHLKRRYLQIQEAKT